MWGLKCVDGLVMFASLCSIMQSIPVIPTSGHFFLFWKTTSTELLPHINFLQTKTQKLILSYFKHGLVKVTSESDTKMHASKILYESLNLPSFPSEHVMRTDKKPFIFIKKLLKEVFRTLHAFNKVLLDESQFRCTKYQVYPALCMETTDIFKQTEKVKTTIHKQLLDFFKHKQFNVGQHPKLYRYITKFLNTAEELDEADGQSQKPRRLYDDSVAHLDSDLNITYYNRNRGSVAVLYALYVHLHNTEASLTYALRVLEQT